MIQMKGFWGEGAQRHSVLFWLAVLAVAFVVVLAVLKLL
jgi:hypothetical protein